MAEARAQGFGRFAFWRRTRFSERATDNLHLPQSRGGRVHRERCGTAHSCGSQWPGALEAGVPNYIDKQLAGAWGTGERLYRSGPWRPGTPSQGYQLPFTPAELFRTALAAINKDLEHAGTPFSKMNSAQQDAYLRRLETGDKDLGGVPSDVFFEHLWQCTLEGFFSDPVYGGNRNMAAWRMIGFPGAYASYYELVDQHGIKVDRAPTSLAEDAHGHVHDEPRHSRQIALNQTGSSLWQSA